MDMEEDMEEENMEDMEKHLARGIDCATCEETSDASLINLCCSQDGG